MSCTNRMSFLALPDQRVWIVFGLYCSPRLLCQANLLSGYSGTFGEIR